MLQYYSIYLIQKYCLLIYYCEGDAAGFIMAKGERIKVWTQPGSTLSMELTDDKKMNIAYIHMYIGL